MARDQNVEGCQNIIIYNSPFESISEFKYLGINLTDQNIIQEKLRAD
jgi:hypothetical protein